MVACCGCVLAPACRVSWCSATVLLHGVLLCVVACCLVERCPVRVVLFCYLRLQRVVCTHPDPSTAGTPHSRLGASAGEAPQHTGQVTDRLCRRSSAGTTSLQRHLPVAGSLINTCRHRVSSSHGEPQLTRQKRRAAKGCKFAHARVVHCRARGASRSPLCMTRSNQLSGSRPMRVHERPASP